MHGATFAAAFEAGEDIPADLWPPDLLPGAEEYLSAFWEMSSDRQLGMQAGPIPFSSLDRWAMRAGIDDPDEFALLASCIRAMDAEWLGQGKQVAPAAKPTSQRPMSAELFDALF